MATARDLALDANYDLALQGQDLAPLVTDNDAIVSDVEATLQFMKGEWFADLSQGLPWFQQILGPKNPNLTTMRNQIFQAIAARKGITQVLSVIVTPNFPTRTASITWLAQADATQLGSTVVLSP